MKFIFNQGLDDLTSSVDFGLLGLGLCLDGLPGLRRLGCLLAHGGKPGLLLILAPGGLGFTFSPNRGLKFRIVRVSQGGNCSLL